MPASRRRPHAVPGDLAASDDHTARLRRAQSGDRLDELLLAVAVDAGERDDLAASHRQRHAVDGLQVAVVADVEVLDGEQRIARLARSLVEREQHVASDDEPGQAALGRALPRHGVDPLAAAQDGDPVGDLEHLAELVGDEHDRRAVLLEALDHSDQLRAPPAR